MTSRRLLDETSVTLLKAAEYIEEHGWCQYDLFDEVNRACLDGAIIRSSNNFSLIREIEAQERVAKFLGANLSKRSALGFIHVWNDAPGRTKEEVVAALRGAAMMG